MRLYTFLRVQDTMSVGEFAAAWGGLTAADKLALCLLGVAQRGEA